MEMASMLGFAGVALTLIAVPGPDWAYILAAGLRDHVVLPAVGGLLIGYAMVTAVVAVGVGPLVAAVPGVLTALTVAGAAYLTWLGVGILRHPSEVWADDDGRRATPAPWRFVARGIGVSSLNPKGLLLFLAILPQFVRPDAGWPVSAQLAVLGAIFVLICGAFYVPLGYGASHVLASRPAAARVVARIAGVAMIVVGLALVGERVAELRPPA
jgi:threonine/homoserine/homoserine lactone efflux protein